MPSTIPALLLPTDSVHAHQNLHVCMQLEETTIGTLTGRQACAESLAELEEELSGERIWYTVDRTQLCAGDCYSIHNNPACTHQMCDPVRYV